jgi:3-hydroxy-9,10-secoandrosta-1,3,5(10)-triene-9,17-dione monooxygenase reductase component
VLGPDEFKRALGQFASGVAIITTCDADGQPAGLTASSFTSVSLSPPLVLVCVAHSAQSYEALKDNGKFAVNILSAEQEPVSRRFAAPPASTNAEKFVGLTYHRGRLGMPLIDHAIAQIECSTVHAYPGGDHTIFVGQVEAAYHRADGADPLLYFRGRYGRLAPTGGPR